MRKRCGPYRPCPKPRADWWRESLGVDWFNTAEAEEEVAWNPLTAFGSSVALAVDDYRTSTMFQEVVGTAQVTPAAADTNLVGLIYGTSSQGHQITQATTTRRPTLSSDASRNSFLLFDGTDYMVVNNTKKFFSYFQGAAPVWTLVFYAKSVGDGTLQALFSSNNRTTTSNGFYLGKNADNTLNLFITNNSVAIVNVNTTPTLTTANGWVPIKVTCAGAGANQIKIQIGTATEGSFTMVGGTALDMLSDLHIGGRDTSIDRFFNGGLSSIYILNRVITADEWTAYKLYNPTRTSEEFTPVVDWEYDYNITGKIWADTGKTTPISDGTAIRVIESNVTPIFGSLNRDLISASAGVSPLWRSALINGLSAAEWDGVDDEFPVTYFHEIGGKYTLIFVVLNQDDTDGSHAANNYIAVTGDAHIGNPGGIPYISVRFADAGSIAVNQTNRPNTWNVFVFRRNGSAVSAWSGGKVKSTATNSSGTSATNFGIDVVANFEMDGYQAYVKKVNGLWSDAQVEAEIDRLNALYGI